MKIRQATAEDAHAVAEIQVRSWQAAYPGIVPADLLASLSVEKQEAMWRDWIARAMPQLIVADEGDRLSGWVAFGPSRDEGADAAVAEIWAIYVAAADWGRGIGRQLWLQARERLQEQGFESVGLWAFPENTRAGRFYEALGFVLDPTSTKQFELGGAKLNEVRYARRLGA